MQRCKHRNTSTQCTSNIYHRTTSFRTKMSSPLFPSIPSQEAPLFERLPFQLKAPFPPTAVRDKTGYAQHPFFSPQQTGCVISVYQSNFTWFRSSGEVVVLPQRYSSGQTLPTPIFLERTHDQPEVYLNSKTNKQYAHTQAHIERESIKLSQSIKNKPPCTARLRNN